VRGPARLGVLDPKPWREALAVVVRVVAVPVVAGVVAPVEVEVVAVVDDGGGGSG